MGKLIDLTRQVFGKLTVIERAEKRPVGKRQVMKTYWLCRCDCDNYKVIVGDNLRSGASRSCGCEVVRSTIERSTKHGGDKRGERERLYTIWVHMRGRCNKETDAAYKHYGDRGISICEEWNHSYEAFRNWAVTNGYNDDLTIDRIDVNGNYEPDNCRWIPQSEQTKNTRRNIRVTIGEITHSLKEWCDELNLNYTTVQHRRRIKGWDVLDAMFTPAFSNCKEKQVV